MTLSDPRCACGCGEVLTRARTGPAPVYASASCRQRAHRRRQYERTLAELDASAVAGAVGSVPVPAPSTSPADRQLERAVLEARAVAFAMTRLGMELRPELAWRATKTGEGLLALLAENFGVEVTR